jgi:hypothetical protein
LFSCKAFFSRPCHEARFSLRGSKSNIQTRKQARQSEITGAIGKKENGIYKDAEAEEQREMPNKPEPWNTLLSPGTMSA